MVRVRLWKVELQKLADETGLVLCVHHYPPGTSKWNKIEHRLFCHITQNWRGRPLTDRLAVVELIGATTTKTGLKVESALDTRCYQKGTDAACGNGPAAINWNEWSRSIGIAGRDHSVRAPAARASSHSGHRVQVPRTAEKCAPGPQRFGRPNDIELGDHRSPPSFQTGLPLDGADNLGDLFNPLNTEQAVGADAPRIVTGEVNALPVYVAIW
jgi:hypothetical protein